MAVAVVAVGALLLLAGLLVLVRSSRPNAVPGRTRRPARATVTTAAAARPSAPLPAALDGATRGGQGRSGTTTRDSSGGVGQPADAASGGPTRANESGGSRPRRGPLGSRRRAAVAGPASTVPGASAPRASAERAGASRRAITARAEPSPAPPSDAVPAPRAAPAESDPVRAGDSGGAGAVLDDLSAPAPSDQEGRSAAAPGPTRDGSVADVASTRSWPGTQAGSTAATGRGGRPDNHDNHDNHGDAPAPDPGRSSAAVAPVDDEDGAPTRVDAGAAAETPGAPAAPPRPGAAGTDPAPAEDGGLPQASHNVRRGAPEDGARPPAPADSGPADGAATEEPRPAAEPSTEPPAPRRSASRPPEPPPAARRRPQPTPGRQRTAGRPATPERRTRGGRPDDPRQAAVYEALLVNEQVLDEVWFSSSVDVFRVVAGVAANALDAHDEDPAAFAEWVAVHRTGQCDCH